MSRRFINRRKEWSDRVEQWIQSGKSAQAWCRENQVVYTTFMVWRKRLELDLKNFQDQPVQKITQTPFIELKDKAEENLGIFLECAGIKIHLSKNFDADLLKKCISVLRGVSC